MVHGSRSVHEINPDCGLKLSRAQKRNTYAEVIYDNSDREKYNKGNAYYSIEYSHYILFRSAWYHI